MDLIRGLSTRAGAVNNKRQLVFVGRENMRHPVGWQGMQETEGILMSLSGTLNDSLCSAAVFRSGWRYPWRLAKLNIVTSDRRSEFFVTGPRVSCLRRKALMSATVTSPMLALTWPVKRFK